MLLEISHTFYSRTIMVGFKLRVLIVVLVETCKGFIMTDSCIPIPSIFMTPYDSRSKEKPVVEGIAPLCRFEIEGFELLAADQEET